MYVCICISAAGPM